MFSLYALKRAAWDKVLGCSKAYSLGIVSINKPLYNVSHRTAERERERERDRQVKCYRLLELFCCMNVSLSRSVNRYSAS